MKIVKLNRRFKQYKENGHTIALRFNGFTKQARDFEAVCKSRLDDAGWMPGGNWYHYFGDRPNRNAVRPYWITFRNESDLTMIMLCANIN